MHPSTAKDMSSDESYLEKMRRSLLGADEIWMKDAQDAAVREEQRANAKPAAEKNDAKENASEGKKKLLAPEEKSQALEHGTGVPSSSSGDSGFLRSMLAKAAEAEVKVRR